MTTTLVVVLILINLAVWVWVFVINREVLRLQAEESIFHQDIERLENSKIEFERLMVAHSTSWKVFVESLPPRMQSRILSKIERR